MTPALNKVFRITTWIMGIPLILLGLLIIASTLLVSFFGGPREPPSGMSPEEFRAWTGSGRWFWCSLLRGAILVCNPLPLFWSLRRGRSRKT